MARTKTLNILGNITNFGFFFRFQPYFFCNREKKFYYYWNSCYGFAIAISVQLFFQFYLILHCVRLSLMSDSSSITSIMQYYATFIYTSLNFNHYITVKHYGNHHNIINAFLLTTETLSGNIKLSFRINTSLNWK